MMSGYGNGPRQPPGQNLKPGSGWARRNANKNSPQSPDFRGTVKTPEGIVYFVSAWHKPASQSQNGEWMPEAFSLSVTPINQQGQQQQPGQQFNDHGVGSQQFNGGGQQFNGGGQQGGGWQQPQSNQQFNGGGQQGGWQQPNQQPQGQRSMGQQIDDDVPF